MPHAGERLAELTRQRDAENRIGRAIGGAQHAVTTDAEHTRGKMLEHRAQIAALRFGPSVLRCARAPARSSSRCIWLKELSRNRVRRGSRPAAACRSGPRPDRAASPPRAGRSGDEPACDAERGEQSEQHRQQQHEGQYEAEGELERTAQELEPAESKLADSTRCVSGRNFGGSGNSVCSNRGEPLATLLRTSTRSMSWSPTGSAAA